MPGAKSSTTATDSLLPWLTHPNIYSITDIESVGQGADTFVRHARAPRAGTTLDVAGECPKGVLFMKLCMACAYPSTPVLSGVWRTCGLIRGAGTSVQIRAIQRDTFGVDKNLCGVSPQVTASGVLAFGQIFATLSPGNGVSPPGQEINSLRFLPATIHSRVTRRAPAR